MPDRDVIIAGGGPAGGTLALALCGAGLAVTVIEARPPDSASDDLRPIALSHGSRLLLERVGLWNGLEPATPIDRIHVSQRGGFGRVELTAAAARLPALGYVVDYMRLASAVTRALRDAGCEYLAGATIVGTDIERDAVNVTANTGATGIRLAGRLLVIADGGMMSGPDEFQTIDYRQTAVTARVRSDAPQAHVAWERFCPEGPLALLPCGDHLALVWTTAPERAQILCAAQEPEFLDALRAAFGGRLGRFTSVERRSAYPLALRRARRLIGPRTVRIGSAAQALHPVAGQGLNLALRDAWELGVELKRAPDEIGEPQALARYAARRRLDRAGGLGFTHGMVQLFAGDAAPLRWARGLGLAALAAVPPARNFLVRRMTFGARG